MANCPVTVGQIVHIVWVLYPSTENKAGWACPNKYLFHRFLQTYIVHRAQSSTRRLLTKRKQKKESDQNICTPSLIENSSDSQDDTLHWQSLPVNLSFNDLSFQGARFGHG